MITLVIFLGSNIAGEGNTRPASTMHCNTIDMFKIYHLYLTARCRHPIKDIPITIVLTGY